MRIWKDFRYGVCYYPEHWDPRRHESDIRRMAAAGLNIVRLGEGAWGYWEPREGQFQFELFDRVIGLCRKFGIKVLMGTPTYCAPAWVASKYPEVLRADFQRIPMGHGSRRNFNYTSPKYYQLSDRICGALAEHYQNERQIIGWQLDNEFNGHMSVSYAPSDEAAFRLWLQERYGTVGRLNRAWGTAFWSQQYDSWEQIHLPQPTPTYQNPTALLDENRFISACVVRFAQSQARILRRANPGWIITHNHLFERINGPTLAGVLDFLAADQYPLFAGHWTGPASWLQQARGLSFPFAVIEQQAGPGGQMDYLQRTPRPGEVRLWAFQSVAHGAKMVEYFLWRTCPFGSEQHWHGLLDQDNRDTRRLAEAKRTGRDLAKLPAAFFDAPVLKGYALIRDFDNEVNARRINTYPRRPDRPDEMFLWAAELGKRHLPADQVWSGADLRGYKVLVLGHFKIVAPTLVVKVTAFVKAGGVLVLGAQSGLKDTNCHIVQRPLPGLFAPLAGVEVEDWTTLPGGETREVEFAAEFGGGAAELDIFVERLKLRGAQTIARWRTGDPLLTTADGGAPAITRHKVGKGWVYYVGGHCPGSAAARLIEVLNRATGLEPVATAGEDVEAIVRVAGAGRGRKPRTWTVLLNHAAEDRRVEGVRGVELLGERPVDGAVQLPAYGVAVVQSR
jgi:beta-galactosidase